MLPDHWSANPHVRSDWQPAAHLPLVSLDWLDLTLIIHTCGGRVTFRVMLMRPALPVENSCTCQIDGENLWWKTRAEGGTGLKHASWRQRLCRRMRIELRQVQLDDEWMRNGRDLGLCSQRILWLKVPLSDVSGITFRWHECLGSSSNFPL